MDALVVEILNRRDHVQMRQRIEGKQRFTIGRSADCDVILDDAYAAAEHAEVDVDPNGAITLTDRGSVNGIWVNGHRIRGAQATPLTGNEFRVGHTRIRVRTSNEQLAPERADGAAGRETRVVYGKWFAIGMIACIAWTVFTTWLDVPRDIAVRVASMLVGFAIAAGAWIGFWALLSRVMLLEWRWLRHGAILFCSVAAVMIVDSLFDIGLFAFDLRLPHWLRIALGTIIAGGILFLHLRHASPLGKRIASIVAFVIPALAFGTLSWVEARSQRNNVNYVEPAPEVFPPFLRVRAAKPLDEFFASTAKLKAEADEKRRIAIEEGEDEEMLYAD